MGGHGSRRKDFSKAIGFNFKAKRGARTSKRGKGRGKVVTLSKKLVEKLGKEILGCRHSTSTKEKNKGPFGVFEQFGACRSQA